MEYFTWYYIIGAIVSFILLVIRIVDDNGFADVGDILTCFSLALIPIIRECLLIGVYGKTVMNIVVFTKGEDK
jgi:hypothetical protein